MRSPWSLDGVGLRPRMPLEALSLELCLDSLHPPKYWTAGSGLLLSVQAGACLCVMVQEPQRRFSASSPSERACPNSLVPSGRSRAHMQHQPAHQPMPVRCLDEQLDAITYCRRPSASKRHPASSHGLDPLRDQKQLPAVAPSRRGGALLPTRESRSCLVPRLGAQLRRHSTLLSMSSGL